jgi:hypothetical protein
MKKLLIAAACTGLLALFLLLAASSLAAQLRGPTFDPVAYAHEQQAIAQAEALAPLDVAMAAFWRVLPAVALVGGLLYLASLGVAHVARFRHERQPNAAGLLPVNAHLLDDVAPAALAAFHQARIEEARRPNVPHSLNYSPSYHHRADAGGAALSLVDEPAPLSLPGLTDLASLGFVPTKEAILLGLGAGGERITVPAAGLCHVALVGATGGGKSNLLRLLLPQLQAIGARVCLADPHHAPVDPETGEDWRPIVARLHMAPAVSPAEIAQLLGYLTDELGRRLALRRAGERWGAPLFLALDELPVIADTVPDAVDQLGRLLREGRKVSLYSVGASQSMLVKVVGGDSSAREAYRTAFYVGGDLKSAAVLLDMRQADIDEGALGAGVALLRSKATSPAALVRVPYVSNAAIHGLLGDAAGGFQEATEQATGGRVITPPAEAWRKPDGSQMVASDAQATTASGRGGAPSAEAQRALALFVAGQDLAAVVFALRGVKSSEGRRYQAAAAEVQGLLRGALGVAQQGGA